MEHVYLSGLENDTLIEACFYDAYEYYEELGISPEEEDIVGYISLWWESWYKKIREDDVENIKRNVHRIMKALIKMWIRGWSIYE